MKQEQVTIKAVCRGRYATLPRRMHPGDAGFDLVANSRQMDIENNCYVYGTGLSVEVPRGYVMLIFPRSSCYKHAALMANCVGVIDSGYRGEIHIVFKGLTSCYKLGDRIAQAVVMPVPEVCYQQMEALGEGDRGEDGLGSTGV